MTTLLVSSNNFILNTKDYDLFFFIIKALEAFDISKVKTYENFEISLASLKKILSKMQKDGKILLCSESECIHLTVIR